MAAQALPVGLDPLIAEAKERARRRRLIALGAIVVAAAVSIGTAYELRSTPGNSGGICSTAPSGWKTRRLTFGLMAPTVVLTNFRFGHMDELYGFTDPKLRWPSNAVTVSVSNNGLAPASSKAGVLRVAATDFRGMEGARKPFATVSVTSHGRIIEAYVMVGAITPTTIAAANEALAGVRVCST